MCAPAKLIKSITSYRGAERYYAHASRGNAWLWVEEQVTVPELIGAGNGCGRQTSDVERL